MHPHLRLAEMKLEALEERLQRLYANYRRRMASLEERMRSEYNLLFEREYSNLKYIATVLAKALALVNKAKSVLSSQSEGIARLRLQGLLSEVEELFDRVTYGHVRVPTALRLEVFKLYKVLKEASEALTGAPE